RIPASRGNFLANISNRTRRVGSDEFMAKVPDLIGEFLHGKRFAVAGVSRQAGQAANAVYRKLRDSGYEVFPANPNTPEAEGTRCYPYLASISGPIDGVLIATHPSISVELVRQCGER